MRHIKNRALRCAGAMAVLVAATGCKDLLSVQNPQAFTNEAADSPLLLPAVAAGAEGNFQLSIDFVAINTGMLSDEMWHTGTWSDWLDVSKGALRPNWPLNGGNTWNFAEDQMLRARGGAVSASQRFLSVMGDSAKTSPLFVTSELARAWSDLYLAMSVCEVPPSDGAATVSDTVLFKQAADTFAALLPIIQNAKFANATLRQDRLNQANAGLARASLMIGNYAVALQAAQAVPAGFRYDAQYSENSGAQNNLMAAQGHANRNRSFSIRDVWFQYIDTIAGQMKDPYSGQLDPRIKVSHDNNNVRGNARGADGVRKFFSIDKYSALGSPIAISKSSEMNLIVAEVRWRQSDFPGAIAAMNVNRTAVGLPGLTLPTSGDVSTQVRDMLLQERFAELFAEGHRMQDLYRFGLVTQRLGAGRATKLPLSRTERLANPNIGEGKATCPAVSS